MGLAGWAPDLSGAAPDVRDRLRRRGGAGVRGLPGSAGRGADPARGLGCLAGVLLFGAVNGFFYNYIGICVGSLMAFAIARNCGKPLLELLFSEKTIRKYSAWTEDNGRFARLFAWAIFLPVARTISCATWRAPPR